MSNSAQKPAWDMVIIRHGHDVNYIGVIGVVLGISHCAYYKFPELHHYAMLRNYTTISDTGPDLDFGKWAANSPWMGENSLRPAGDNPPAKF